MSPDYLWLVAASSSAAVVCCGSQPVLVRRLTRRGVLDRPNHRSSHTAPVPRGAGLGVGLGVVAGSAFVLVPDAQGHRLLVGLSLAPALLAALIGAIDDRRGLSASSRLLLQMIIGAFVATGFAVAASAADEVTGSLVGVVVAGAFVVAYINAFNFMDGVNGISGINAGVSAVWLAALALVHGDLGTAILAAAVLGASVGFLPWNFPTARIFLGDVGSYLFGAVLAAIAVGLAMRGAPIELVVAPFILYAFDTGSTLIWRARRGHRLTEAHRDHTYQRMSRAWGHPSAVGLNIAATGVCLIIAGLAVGLEAMWLLTLLAVPLGIYAQLGRVAESRKAR